jgi:hypothetical protein
MLSGIGSNRRRLVAAAAAALLFPNLALFGLHHAAVSLPLQPIKEHITLAIYRGNILSEPLSRPSLSSSTARVRDLVGHHHGVFRCALHDCVGGRYGGLSTLQYGDQFSVDLAEAAFRPRTGGVG